MCRSGNTYKLYKFRSRNNGYNDYKAYFFKLSETFNTDSVGREKASTVRPIYTLRRWRYRFLSVFNALGIKSIYTWLNCSDSIPVIHYQTYI